MFKHQPFELKGSKMNFSNSSLSKLVENSIYLYPGMNAERCAQVNFRREFKVIQNYTVTQPEGTSCSFVELGTLHRTTKVVFVSKVTAAGAHTSVDLPGTQSTHLCYLPLLQPIPVAHDSG